MKAYRNYMDRQQVSPDLHRRLLALEDDAAPAPRAGKPLPWKRYAALAAALCLAVGLGLFRSGLLGGMGGAASDMAADAPAAAPLDSGESVLTEGQTESYMILEEEAADKETAQDSMADEPAEMPANEEASQPEDDIPAEKGQDLSLSGVGQLDFCPEGYALAACDVTENSQCIRWEKAGESITVRRIFSPTPEDRARYEALGYPFYAGDETRWEAAETEEGWGFLLDWGDSLEICSATDPSVDLSELLTTLWDYEW